jgi:beta-lactamase class A
LRGTYTFPSFNLLRNRPDSIKESAQAETDAILARVGGLSSLNRWYSERGFGQMRMHTTIGAYFAVVAPMITPLARGLSEAEINATLVGQRMDELTPAGKAAATELWKMEPWLGVCDRFKDPGTWLGSLSARSVGKLLEQMETAKLVSKANSDEMMGMLKSQQAGKRRIPMYLDTQYVIGNKTGDFSPCVANDVGVVYLRSGPTIMVFLSDQIRGNYGEAEARVGEIARTVAEYFDGK